MEKNDKLFEILEKINVVRASKKISIEKISKDILKDKSVTSRILNGKYNLDLLTYINICNSLEINPVDLLESILYPNEKRIPISKKSIESFEDILKSIKDYQDFFENK